MPSARNFLVVLSLGLALAACGRRGSLEPPSGGKTFPTEVEEGTPDGAPATGEVQTGRRGRTTVTVPRDRFILDPLL
jgi:predicted small lipoprotein YifL